MTSKYEESEDRTGLCPFCEKPVASNEAMKEYDTRLIATDYNIDNPELQAWAGQFCWYGWAQLGECRNGMSIEERLLEVLEQRDEARGILASSPFGGE